MIFEGYAEELDELKQNSNFRSIKNVNKKEGKFIFVDGKKMLNLSSNDYLNLSTDEDLKFEFIEKYKYNSEFLFSSASARLLTGTSEVYKNLETTFAHLFNKESALLFNTGYQCNQGIITALFSRGDCIFSDKLNHASIVSGLQISRADHFRYKHNDMGNLETLLKSNRDKYKNAVIISESVFSMDGDISDIKKLVELKEKYNCLLMIDEAHAFGVFGEKLQGVAQELGLLDKVDIITVTLGKSLASMGAVCISSKTIIDYLVNKASSFIFSTALAPVNVMWSDFLLNEKFEVLKKKKEKLNNLFKKVHSIYPSISSSQIIPVILGSAEKTSETAKNLQEQGFYVLPINPPTVPVNTSRLRLSLCADMTFEEIVPLFEVIK